jgi:hypothetical protein
VRQWYLRQQHRHIICAGTLTSSSAERRRTIHAGIGGRVGYEVSVRIEGEKGMGLVALEFFPRGAIVTQYEGFIIDRAEADSMGEAATHVYSFGKLAIDGLRDREEAKGFGGGSFVNHSDDPNTIYVHDDLGRVFLKAIRPIEKFEFISARYGSKYIREKKLFSPK